MDTSEQSATLGTTAPTFSGNLFEQYRLIEKATTLISERRHSTNRLFLSVNSIILSASALLLQQGLESLNAFLLYLSLPLLVAGSVLCLIWVRLLFGYHDRISGRIGYLRQLEATFPDKLLPIYTSQDAKTRRSFSKIEAWIPVVFLFAYVITFSAAIAIGLGVSTLLPPIRFR
jgi:hypothetical protein